MRAETDDWEYMGGCGGFGGGIQESEVTSQAESSVRPERVRR